MGFGTIASGDAAIAMGQYNKSSDDNNHYLLSIGNGTANDNRSNALAVTSQGKLQLGDNDALGSVAAADADSFTKLLAALMRMGIIGD